MKELFTTYNIALAMKELGFDKACLGVIYQDGEIMVGSPEWVEIMLKKDVCIKVPTSQQAFDWFRKEHNLHGEPIWDNDSKTYWFYSITEIGNVNFTEGRHMYESPLKEDQDVKDGYPVVLKWVETYEEAQDACLQKLIDIVKEM